MHIEYNILNNEKLMHFEIRKGDEIAFLEYRFYRNDIALMHTEVPGNMEGKGVGSALAEYAFKYARDNKKLVKIYCPFVLAYMKKHPEVRELLDKESHQ